MEPSVPPGRREPASRAQTRRPAPGRAPPSSCELLLELAEDPSIAALLAGFGVDRAALVRLGGELRASLDPEPADWRVRLAQRGAGKLGLGPLDQLLAIVRSADCHAYQLLEHAGVACGPLRKQIIALLRERGTEAIHREPRRALGRRPTRVAATSEPEVTARVSRTQDTRAQPRPEVASSERGRLVAVDPEALGPLAGRDSELARLADALRRSAPRPPALIGAHGSGRTLIARHLARLLREPIFHVSAPDYEDDEALRADLAVVAGRGGVLILDDLDRVIADAAPPLLPALSQALSSGAPPVLLILSHEGLARLRGWLPGVGEVLDLIEVGPLSPTEAARAVRLASDALLARHGAQLARDAHPAELARLADRFLAGPAMPGRALDLLDLSCARSVREGKEHVRRETWIDIVCERSGLPRERVAGNGAGREERWMLDLEAEIARQVVGHELILSTLADLIRRNRAGFGSDRPVATALLLGPSGVGKTET
ncbi:MAG: ATP-dependent Clp protease ATP-binding subunit, partial [Myxococcales bacterium]|nr:ATP-dependent Clp protease ATP-binding subunit [Myxococcales bacterium]